MTIFRELGIQDTKGRLKEEVLYNLAACYSMAEKKINRVLARHGLSPVKMNALLLIKHTGGKEGIAQVEMGKKMIVSAGNITGLVDRLEREGLARRVPLRGDRRVNLIRITRKGSDLLDAVWPKYQEAVNELFSMIPTQALSGVRTHLNDIREKFKRWEAI